MDIDIVRYHWSDIFKKAENFSHIVSEVKSRFTDDYDILFDVRNRKYCMVKFTDRPYYHPEVIHYFERREPNMRELEGFKIRSAKEFFREQSAYRDAFEASKAREENALAIDAANDVKNLSSRTISVG